MDFKNLIENIRKERVTLFLGSGFSFKAGGPRSSVLVDSLLSKAFDGTIYKGSILYRRFDRLIAEYESSVEEVAAEMNIAPRELQEKLDYLKKGQVNEKEIGKPILDAINRIYSRKVDNGELVPGYMKLFRERGLL